jgi:hypothetical protein
VVGERAMGKGVWYVCVGGGVRGIVRVGCSLGWWASGRWAKVGGGGVAGLCKVAAHWVISCMIGSAHWTAAS